jgi:hypothetical protein
VPSLGRAFVLSVLPYLLLWRDIESLHSRPSVVSVQAARSRSVCTFL